MPLDLSEILARIGMAFLSGFILGVERSSHGRAAGLRTTILVCVAAATAAILSELYYVGSFSGEQMSQTWHPDPARLGAGVLTGIGFLGAGTIIREGNFVRGLTTASIIWLVTILGLCYGSGKFLLGTLGLGTSVLTVFLLRYVEVFIKPDWYATLTVTVSLQGASVSDISKLIREMNIHINNVELIHDVTDKTRTAAFILRFKKGRVLEFPEKVVKQIIAMPGVLRVDWK